MLPEHCHAVLDTSSHPRLGSCRLPAGERRACGKIRPVRTVLVDPEPVLDGRQAVGESKPRYEERPLVPRHS